MKLEKINNFILTVDGRSSSGKSTAAKLLAKKFRIPLLSSGLLYRWSAKKLLENKPNNEISYLKKHLRYSGFLIFGIMMLTAFKGYDLP